MNVIDLINNSKSTAFSFEILPPLKGNSIQKVYNVIDKLREFDPKYINITSHHSENIYKAQPDGSLRKVNVRKRPGRVAERTCLKCEIEDNSSSIGFVTCCSTDSVLAPG